MRCCLVCNSLHAVKPKRRGHKLTNTILGTSDRTYTSSSDPIDQIYYETNTETRFIGVSGRPGAAIRFSADPRVPRTRNRSGVSVGHLVPSPRPLPGTQPLTTEWGGRRLYRLAASTTQSAEAQSARSCLGISPSQPRHAHVVYTPVHVDQSDRSPARPSTKGVRHSQHRPLAHKPGIWARRAAA